MNNVWFYHPCKFIKGSGQGVISFAFSSFTKIDILEDHNCSIISENSVFQFEIHLTNGARIEKLLDRVNETYINLANFSDDVKPHIDRLSSSGKWDDFAESLDGCPIRRRAFNLRQSQLLFNYCGGGGLKLILVTNTYRIWIHLAAGAMRENANSNQKSFQLHFTTNFFVIFQLKATFEWSWRENSFHIYPQSNLRNFWCIKLNYSWTGIKLILSGLFCLSSYWLLKFKS